MHLVAVATYMDRTEDEDNDSNNNDPAPGYMNIRFNNRAMSMPTAPVTDDPANAAPMFVEGERAVRYVEEDDEENRPNRSPAETIGAPLMITDADLPDGVPTPTSHAYTLGGADAASFDINAGTGQLMTKAMLDYDGTKNSYTVVVTVDDGSGASNATDSITVTIEVKDLDEKPMIFEAGLTIRGLSSRGYAENGMDDVDTYTAAGPNAASATWSVEGDDAGDFNISSAGVLSFNSSPNYEMPADADMDNTYEVTIKANDGTYMDTQEVMVMVTNVDEIGTLSGSETVSNYMETSDDPVGTYTVSGGSMSEMANLTLEGDDAGDFSISSAGVLSFNSSPNFEAPMDDGGDNTYMVTVKAEAGGEVQTRDVTVTVTNMEEDGSVTLSPMNPVVGVELTATLTDPDGSVTGETWMWYKSMDSTFMDGNEMEIGDATSAYTPMADDEGYHLMVKVMYTDGHGAGKEAMATTTGMVTTVPDQMGTLRLSPMNPVVGTELTATLTDPDGSVTGETWMWYKSMDSTFMDGNEMEIGDATSAYTPMADDEGYHLMVKVMYTDGHGAGKEAMATTTGMVTTVPDQMGTLRLSPMNPVVGTELTATLTDPDGSVTGETWMWYKSMDETFMDGNEMEIGDATSAYTPMADDEGYHLMVKVMYTDGHGAGKEAMATTTNKVVADADALLVARYDTNPSNGQIDKSEVIAAINDYLFGEGDDAISKADVIRLINLYLFPNG